MRLRGEVTINLCEPVTAEHVQVIFAFEGMTYSWITSWRRNTNITHSIRGDVYNVSFTDCGIKNTTGIHNAKNVRILKKY